MPLQHLAGAADHEAAVYRLAQHVPGRFAALASLAYNYSWSWLPGAEALFERIQPERWRRCGMNPVRLIQEVDPFELERLSSDSTFLDDLDRIHRIASDYQRNRIWTGDPVAYFCAEFGIHKSLPYYAGGLGVLAGDLLKAASDAGLGMVGVGLFYREGSFHQHIDSTGWQHEYWEDTDSDRLPAVLVTSHGQPLTVTVSVHSRPVTVQVWRVAVGTSLLFLLDTDLPSNHPSDRWITSRLYVGNREIRLAQYAVLGIGGVRALRAMDLSPRLIHLNEGHAALAGLERLREELATGAGRPAALERVRQSVVFTTHTPVPSGNETFPLADVQSILPDLAPEAGLDWDDLAALARVNPADQSEPLGLTPLSLRLSGSANGVSRVHGAVARHMWRDVRPETPEAPGAITHITNGVHLPTWMAGEWQTLLDRFVPGWRSEPPESQAWARIDAIPDEEIWRVRCALRARLGQTVRNRSVRERLGRGEGVQYAESAIDLWRDDVLTIGFARRIATYKRLALLISRPDQSARFLSMDPGLQVVIAGRAHPQDDPAKVTVQRLFALNDIPGIGGRGVFLEDYDMDLARDLVSGCDLWLNLPRPPREASGTSGMKSAANGGLQFSVLDGWWAEAYQPGLGWALDGTGSSDEEQDNRDMDQFFDLLGREVLPRFYERDARGLPLQWLAMVRASLRAFIPAFSASRMLAEYQQRAYATVP